MAESDPGIIRKLEEAVVNRIAAGEIIQRPANALKEMIENCLDAKSSSIQIVVKSGGLKYLQIQDNGTGIRKEDLEIVCERFTTSKLQKFEDLSSISTYGFRGEALSSISHVAHLTIQTKTKNDKCGFKASYEDGKLKGSVKACALNQGTQITVEDLFYNVPTRKQGLKAPNEEFQKISDVISKYAVHNPRVAFLLKKFGESNAIRTQAKSTKVDNIRTIYGTSIAKSLLNVNLDYEVLQLKLEAYMSNVNFTLKKGIFLLFINHRAVESTAIKKAIDQIYSLYIPKGSQPFVYMSLELDPMNVDVNVHPTKHEVHFLHEDDIIEKIKEAVEKTLLGSNASRTFYTQSRLPGAPEPSTNKETNDSVSEKSIQPKNIVRTNSKDQKLEKFFGTQNAISPSCGSGPRSKNRKETHLTSILSIRKSIEDNCDTHLRKMLSEMTFVGIVDRTYSIIQHVTKMYLCNTAMLSEVLFYQILLYDFENFDVIKFSNPLPIKELATLALSNEESGWTPEDGPIEELVERIEQIIVEKLDILKEYFNITINSDNCLESLPLLLENHSPPLSQLPMYILRLATEVNWDEEKECFQTLCEETAKFYAKIPLTTEEKVWKWEIEHIIYPAFRQFLLPPKSFNANKSFLQIANLSEMYRVFERC